jgi:hypothetical protein
MLGGIGVRRSGPKRFIWYVTVCDYEACWPIAFFDSEAKAQAHLENYKLNKRNFEQQKFICKSEVF